MSTSNRTGRGIGPIAQPFDGIERIAVLRGGGLGDLLFIMPALDALAAAYPGAGITLLGTPVHAALLAGRESPVSDVEILPVGHGIRQPRDGEQENPGDTAEFLARMQARGFDLAVQLHGGGRNSNPFLLSLGARHTAGTRTPDAVRLERSLPYVLYQHDVLRALEVAGLAGAPPVTLEPHIIPTTAERAEASALAGAGPVMVIHPGATDPRRRWPAPRFAEVAVRAAADGCRVLVVGDESDRQAAAEIVRRAEEAGVERVSSLAGQLTLSQLTGLLAVSDVVVANDSGPRHLAQAVGARTVGIYWIGNVVNASPLGRAHHRVHISWLTRCPRCGVDVTQVGWTAPRCPHDDSHVADIDPDAVYADAAELMATTLPPRGK